LRFEGDATTSVKIVYPRSSVRKYPLKTKILFIVALLTVLSLAPLTVAIDNGADSTPSPDGILTGYAIVTLKDQPLAAYDGHVPGYARTMPVPGQKLDLNSPAAQAYSSYLANARGAAKGWLANTMPTLQVVNEYSIVLNGLAVRLNGNAMNGLLNAPGANWVSNDYLYHTEMNRSPTLIGAQTLWTAVGGQGNAGAGVKIGIIDTGIDQTHPFLTDNSLTIPAGFPKCDAIDSAIGTPDTQCKFVSNKVIVAKVFETLTNFDAHAAQAHGSHVSGIAAGVANTCAPFVGCTLSGIAPKAFLGNYNVFPGNVLSASSHDIAKAVEAAVADGMDVLNLSLGGTANPNDVLVNAVNSATDAGVVVAIAAGNSGPGAGTVDSPGIADKVITVGASTNPHFIGVPATVTGIGTFGASVGQFASYVPAITATYALTTPSNGCTAIIQNLSNEIALIRRGLCTFTTKVRNAQNAGAIGVIVINSQQGDPIAMAQDGTTPVPTIPAVMVSITNGNAMAAIAPNTVTIDGTTPKEFFSDGAGADILASFSSRGPPLLQSPGVGIGQPQDKIKPDVVAPGVNVYSSVPSFACASPPCFAFFQGTSMATPHVAGSAALLIQLHPNWSPEQVKSALVNSAHRPVKSSTTGSALSNPMNRGAGRIDLAAASQVSATLETSPTPSTLGNGQASFSFGELRASAQTRSFTITLTSVSTSTVTYAVSVAPAVMGPTVSPSVTSMTLTAAGTATVNISLTLSPSLEGAFYGDVQLSGGPVPLRVPYWVTVDPSAGADPQIHAR
jgi:minor extracellular serine protease Vpr